MRPRRDEGFSKLPSLILLSLISSLIISCHSGDAEKGTTAKKVFSNSGKGKYQNVLQTLFGGTDTSQGKSKNITADLRYVYLLADYRPLWLNDDGALNKAAQQYLTELQDVQWDGLDPERYNLTALKKLAADGSTSKDVNSAVAADTLFTRSYLSAAKDLLFGAISPKQADSLWFHKNDTVWTAPKMLLNNDVHYASLDEYRSKVPTYSLLRDEYKRLKGLVNDSGLVQNMNLLKSSDAIALHDTAAMQHVNAVMKAEMPWIRTDPNDSISEQVQWIRAYQNYTGVKPTGKVDSSTLHMLVSGQEDMLNNLRANMERVRWMQRQIGDEYILVDVPLAEFFFRKDGQTVMHMRTVVGKPVRQTPSLDANMANVVINPPWGVPPTILKKDVLPGMQKSSRYLAKKGLKAYDKKGHLVNASTINANNYKHFDYKQAPGDGNSLGYVKFNLPNPWDIYLHDTPHRGDFGNRYRCLSSGCIRLQKPQPLALYILGELEKKNYTQERLDSMIKTHKTRWEVLKNQIPVHIVYLTAFEDTTGQHIRFIPDVYKRDDKLISLLMK